MPFLSMLYLSLLVERGEIAYASRLYEIVTRLMPERASYKCNRRRMAFGVIFQNNARALRYRGRNPRCTPSSCYTRRLHTNAMGAALQGRKGGTRNLKASLHVTSDVVTRTWILLRCDNVARNIRSFV